MQYLHKGDKITVVGDLVIRPYLDKNGVVSAPEVSQTFPFRSSHP